MPSLNKVQLIGRLGADPAERTTAKGTKYVTFSVAVDRFWKGAEGKTNKATDWFNIALTAMRKMVKQNISPGSYCEECRN